MSAKHTIQIVLSDADEATYATLSPADKMAFLIVRLAVQMAPVLTTSLGNANILGLLSPADQQTIQNLLALGSKT
jgi:hypothetical protein